MMTPCRFSGGASPGRADVPHPEADGQRFNAFNSAPARRPARVATLNADVLADPVAREKEGSPEQAAHSKQSEHEG